MQSFWSNNSLTTGPRFGKLTGQRMSAHFFNILITAYTLVASWYRTAFLMAPRCLLAAVPPQITHTTAET
ncbi:unnamed protein product [Caretta caretta]